MDQDAQLGAVITFCSSATGARVQGSNDILLLVSQSCAMRKKTTVRSSEGGEGEKMYRPGLGFKQIATVFSLVIDKNLQLVQLLKG